MKQSKRQSFKTSSNWKISRPKSVSSNKFSISKTFSIRKRFTTQQNDNKSTNDVKDYQFQMDQVKISALKSIYKGIKQYSCLNSRLNEVGYITGFRSKKLRTQPIFQDDLIHQSAHQTLIQTRKKFDSVFQKKATIDTNIKKLNLQLQKYQKEIQGYNVRKQSGAAAMNRRDQLNQDADIAFIKVQDQKKVYKHIKERLRQDKEFYYEKKFMLANQLEHLNKRLKILRNDGRQVNQSLDRSTKFFEKMKQQMQDQNFQRQEHLANLQSIIDMKQQAIESEYQRSLQITDIAYKTTVEKDEAQKQWKKIYFTHMLVTGILKNKIDIQMKKFNLVENAFLQIKGRTGITQGKQMVSRFFNKDKVYGQLLAKIAQNDRKLQSLKRDQYTLINQFKENELLSVKFKQDRKTDQNFHGQAQLNFYSEKSKRIKTIKSKIKQWIQRQNKKMSNFRKQQQDSQNILRSDKDISESDKDISEQLKILLLRLKQQFQQAQRQGQPSIDISNGDSNDLGSNQQFKLTRIRLNAARKQSLNSSKLFQKDDNEQQSVRNPNEQLEVINAQRELISKKNQKFLKQAHRKMIQQKKMMLDKPFQTEKKKLKPQH